MLMFYVCSVRLNLYVFSLYRNPDLGDLFFDCLLTSMAAMHALRMCVPIACWGWIEWPSSLVDGFYDHESSWYCRLWLRNCVWLRSVGCRLDPCTGGTLDLLMTDVPDLARVAVIAPIGNSDHSFLSAVISMAQAVNLCISRKVFLKH